MKHTEKLNMQDSASFVITLVIMAGTYVYVPAMITSVITNEAESCMLSFSVYGNHG